MRYFVTHSELDACAQIGQNVRVKMFLRHHCHTLMLLGALALVPACKPQGVDMKELEELQARNTQLRQQIAQMNELIRRAGADMPDLTEQLDARNREVVQAYENLQKLKTQETEMQMRRIELEGRLESFRAQFQEMQNEIVTTTSNSQP